jgi:glucose/arabinose dehydrogenase
LYITHAGDGSGLLYVVEQGGRIIVLNSAGSRLSTFLDISGSVTGGSEQGLLGLAFHPSFESNRRFFVNYTDNAGDTIIAEYRATSTRRADASSRRQIMKIDQPYANHNGGMITFGADGYLYIAMGDGGSGGDPQNRAQNLGSLLGKILRINVNSGSPYSSPSTNPFVNRSGARDEIWHYGLRNPWRFSFDRSTRAMFLGDVGQNTWEEVDVTRSSGRNFGWRPMEGSHCYISGCSPSGKVLPIAEYSHSFGCSVTGGYVYRGRSYSSLRGAYFYGDYCSGRIWALDAAAALRGTSRVRQVMDSALSISSFGENEAGEMFVCDHGGAVYRLRAA